MKQRIGFPARLTGLLAWVLCVVVAGGCGGTSSPATASAPPASTPAPPPGPEAPLVIDGWSDQPVAAEAEPPEVLPTHGVVVRAPGYLSREQIYTGEPLTLWPGEQDYFFDLVYSGWEFGDGSFRLVRWTEAFTMALEGDLADDDGVVTKAMEVAAELSRRTGLAISVGPGGSCRVVVDSGIKDYDAVGLTELSFVGPRIVGATVSFIDRAELLGTPRADYRNTFLHEMGHVVGLSHSQLRQDVMTPAEGPGTNLQEFRGPEAIALHMMYSHREQGNRPPDRDEGLLAASIGPPLTTIVGGCRPPVHQH